MTADQKDYFSNLSQETINNSFEDLDELTLRRLGKKAV